ncbi:hypothetical protein VCHE48_2969 [Vibrio cholerae HE48]|nr:hypothetical protein VCHE48_2969 [Vibrio cholerae HE48]
MSHHFASRAIDCQFTRHFKAIISILLLPGKLTGVLSRKSDL